MTMPMVLAIPVGPYARNSRLYSVQSQRGNFVAPAPLPGAFQWSLVQTAISLVASRLRLAGLGGLSRPMMAPGATFQRVPSRVGARWLPSPSESPV